MELSQINKIISYNNIINYLIKWEYSSIYKYARSGYYWFISVL